jgi:hypothetical protein
MKLLRHFLPNLRYDPFAEHVTQQLNGRFFQREATLLGAVRGCQSLPAVEGFAE